MLTSKTSAFVVVGLHETSPAYFWRGKPLTEVIGMRADVDADSRSLRLEVKDTNAFDAIYQDMAQAGFRIKKLKG
jgi:hypothetical protein